MRKNPIQKIEGDEFVSANRHSLSELTKGATNEDIARGYDRLFASVGSILEKHRLRVDVGWSPPDDMFFLQAEPQGRVRLCHYNKGSLEPVDVLQVLDSLFQPREILQALIWELSRELKYKERIIKDLDLVTRAVNGI